QRFFLRAQWQILGIPPRIGDTPNFLGTPPFLGDPPGFGDTPLDLGTPPGFGDPPLFGGTPPDLAPPSSPAPRYIRAITSRGGAWPRVARQRPQRDSPSPAPKTRGAWPQGASPSGPFPLAAEPAKGRGLAARGRTAPIGWLRGEKLQGALLLAAVGGGDVRRAPIGCGRGRGGAEEPWRRRCAPGAGAAERAADLRVELSSNPKTKPEGGALTFGQIFTDHMLTVEWSRGGGWGPPHIRPFQDLRLHPASSALHYAVEVGAPPKKNNPKTPKRPRNSAPNGAELPPPPKKKKMPQNVPECPQKSAPKCPRMTPNQCPKMSPNDPKPVPQNALMPPPKKKIKD
uniref:branched-chain-amino-acid transaminase n=1 Tax=Cairina moschata TaxID=8855 RepID=A0A8C3BKB7_CAIMO